MCKVSALTMDAKCHLVINYKQLLQHLSEYLDTREPEGRNYLPLYVPLQDLFDKVQPHLILSFLRDIDLFNPF